MDTRTGGRLGMHRLRACAEEPNGPAPQGLWHCPSIPLAWTIVIGKRGTEPAMSDRRQMMQHYLDALAQRADYGQYFADDVLLTAVGGDQRAVGRQAAEQQMRDMHERAFDARIEVKNLLVDEDKAAVEADFAGTHIGEFAGIAPTGRTVRVSYSVVYDLRGDQISELRIYFPMSALVEQLTK